MFSWASVRGGGRIWDQRRGEDIGPEWVIGYRSGGVVYRSRGQGIGPGVRV